MWIAALLISLASVGVGVVLYIRRSAANSATVKQQEAQLLQERARRLANEAADRADQVKQEAEFADEAKDVATPDDALRLLAEARSRLR